MPHQIQQHLTMEAIIKELGNNLIEHHYSLSSTESFTVGHFASSIGLVPGISAIYRGSLVSYQTRIKHDVLHVSQDIIDQYGVVSHEVAYAMCKNGQELFDSDICISFTGNATIFAIGAPLLTAARDSS